MHTHSSRPFIPPTYIYASTISDKRGYLFEEDEEGIHERVKGIVEKEEML